MKFFYHSNRIASHVRRSYSPEPIYVPEHMPENHRKFLEYNTDSFLDWGKSVGHSTLIVVKHFLYMHKVEQQGYKSCASLMKRKRKIASTLTFLGGCFAATDI